MFMSIARAWARLSGGEGVLNRKYALSHWRIEKSDSDGSVGREGHNWEEDNVEPPV
jgi:hypothetical protein